jgi:hypothetical protein
MGDLRSAAVPRSLAFGTTTALCAMSLPADGSSAGPRRKSGPLSARISSQTAVLSEIQEPPRHPKPQEAAPSAKMASWTRPSAIEQSLRNRGRICTRSPVQEFLKRNDKRAPQQLGTVGATASSSTDALLFRGVGRKT